MSQHGLNVEHNIWIGLSQRQADARQAFAHASWIQLKPIAQTDGLVDTHEVIIWPMRAGGPFGNGDYVGASLQQVDFNEVRVALPHFGLLGHIR